MGVKQSKQQSNNTSSPNNTNSGESLLSDSSLAGKRYVLLGNTSSGKTTICEMIQNALCAESQENYYRVDNNVISRIIIEQILYSMKEEDKYIISDHIPGLNTADFNNQTLLTLWNDDNFRSIYYSNIDHMNLYENVEIFVENMKNQVDFKPYIYIKGGSSGIIEYDIQLNSGRERLQFVTAGGKVYERKKWRYCLENVSVLVYVVSLSEFNQTCYGDDHINRMDESLKLFNELMSYQLFQNKIGRASCRERV